MSSIGVRITTYDENGVRISLVRRAVAANCSSQSTMSSSLARLLKIEPTEEVTCINPIYGGGTFTVNLPSKLILVEREDAFMDQVYSAQSSSAVPKTKPVLVLPLVNKTGGFWDLILGLDFFNKLDDNINIFCRSPTPSRGPDWKENTTFLGHNVDICNKGEEFQQYALGLIQKWKQEEKLYNDGAKCIMEENPKKKMVTIDDESIQEGLKRQNASNLRINREYHLNLMNGAELMDIDNNETIQTSFNSSTSSSTQGKSTSKSKNKKGKGK